MKTAVEREAVERGVIRDLRDGKLSDKEIAALLNKSGILGKDWTAEKVTARADEREAA